MEPLLGLAVLLLAQLAGGTAHLLDVSLPHTLLPHGCDALWQRVTGDCGPCDTGRTLLAALLRRDLPAFCAR
jgi:hypothetical protein